MVPLKRESLRDQVRESLRDQIVTGELAPGEPLTEAELSTSLGVSRTPLREALLQLEREGMVRAAPPRGFAVAPLTSSEVEELFPIVGALHALALRLTGEVPAAQLDLLRAVNMTIAMNANAETVFNQDLKWHRLLLVRCPNARLLELIGTLHDATRRYDLAYFREAGDALVSAAQHDAIVELLARGDVNAAAQMLDAHWRSGMAPLKAWLDKKETRDAHDQT